MPDELQLLPFQDGYSAGLKMPGLDATDECPMDETDDPTFSEWRRGWLAGQEFRRQQIGA